MRSALAATALLVLASCSSNGLTAAEARPFQSCSQDQDCVAENLTCKQSCNPDVAINRDQVVAFEQERGCWPPSQDSTLCDLGTCQAARCAAGQCVLAPDPFCGQPVPHGNTSTGFSTISTGPGGSSGAVGFDATISTGTSGSSGSSSSTGSGSVGGASGSGSSGGASASSGSGSGSGSSSGSGSGSGSTGGSGTSGSGATT